MRIGVLGINHNSASLELREQVAEACRQCGIVDKVVLSTCHRSEIYFSQNDLAEAQCHLFCTLKKQLLLSQEHAFYSFFGAECFFHLASVTAGLDSAILAESDVQRQVKVAYENSRQHGSLSSPLHYLFQKSLKLGKQVRSLFSLFHAPLHLEAKLFQIVDGLLDSRQKLLFVGNSDINRKIIHYFRRKGDRPIALATTQPQLAVPFALDYQLTLKDRSELANWHLYDGVIAATFCDDYLIRPHLDRVTTRLILDLSVPRIVDPAVQRSPHITLLNMEEIGHFFDHTHLQHRAEIQAVKEFLQSSVARYLALYERKSSIYTK